MPVGGHGRPQGAAQRLPPLRASHIRRRPSLTHPPRPCKNRARPALGGGKVNSWGQRAAHPRRPGRVTGADAEDPEGCRGPRRLHKFKSGRARDGADERGDAGGPRRARARAMRPGGVRTFALELARGPGGAYRGGERLCGRVLLEAAAPLRVRALKVSARGEAATHWLEGRSVGVNAVSSDFTATETYLRRRQLLLRGEQLTPHALAGIPRHPLPRSVCPSPQVCAPLQSREPFNFWAMRSGDPF